MPLPEERSMPEVCEGVPPNPWCNGGHHHHHDDD
jgi:hypothetical protein